jgi:hypothetical protein
VTAWDLPGQVGLARLAQAVAFQRVPAVGARPGLVADSLLVRAADYPLALVAVALRGRDRITTNGIDQIPIASDFIR